MASRTLRRTAPGLILRGKTRLDAIVAVDRRRSTHSVRNGRDGDGSYPALQRTRSRKMSKETTAQSACRIEETGTDNERVSEGLKGPRVIGREDGASKKSTELHAVLSSGEVWEVTRLRHDSCLVGSGTEQADNSHISTL